MLEDSRENVIEWITGQNTITCSFTQQKYVHKIEVLAQKNPEKVKIIAKNPDGSICARLPIKALKLSIIEHELSEEDKKLRADRLKKMLEEKRNDEM